MKKIFFIPLIIPLILFGLEISLQIYWYLKTKISQEPLSFNEFRFYQYDSVLGWKNKPRERGWLTTKEGKFWVEINSFGLRDKEISLSKRKKRILVLGDSFTWGYGVNQGETFSDELEKLFENKVEVINAGVTGYGTDQEFLYLVNEGYKFKPDIVLLVFAFNDLAWDNQAIIAYSYPKPHFIANNNKLILTNVPVPKKKNWIKRNSLPFFKQWKFSYSRKPNLKEKILLFLSEKSILFSLLNLSLKNKLFQGIEITVHLLFNLRDYCIKNNSQFKVVFIPYYRDVKTGKYFPSFESFKKFFEENGISYIDPLPYFRKEYLKGTNLFQKYHNHHFTHKAHKLLAEIIFENIPSFTP